MVSKLIEMIKEALSKMKTTTAKDTDVVKEPDIYTISNAMTDAIELWKDMYMDNSPWLNEDDGIYSMNIPSSICSELTMYVLNEVESHIVVPGQIEKTNAHDESGQDIDIYTNRAVYLDNIYHKHLIPKLQDVVEQAMALGGVIIKPYFSNNGIYFDFCYQGEFYPISFDDDGNITDIAFYDSFIAGKNKYTKIERQTFENNTITIQNKAYKAKFNPDSDTEELGDEIPLSSVERWANIPDEPVYIGDVDKPLYGFYKIPLANNVDMKSPLGISVFSKAARVIKRADYQFSRLDWEYEAGQIAIDVDPTAIVTEASYYGTALKQDELRNRIYRKIDLGTDETYNAFAPALRDANYLAGLNRYLTRIEDIVCVARGTLSDVEAEARTATEIKTLKQKTFDTVHKNQASLQKALEQAIYAANILIDLYQEELQAPDGDYVMNTEWSDSILVDTYAELEQRMNLMDKDVLSKTEVRQWYTGEDTETAQANIEAIKKDKQDSMMNDLFGTLPQSTLEQ